MVETKIIKKEEVKNRIYKYFNNNNKATRKELTDYMNDLWEEKKEQAKTNNLIGKILNEETRSNKFTKERGDKNQLVFTLVAGGLETEELVEELEEVDEDEEEVDEEVDEDEDEDDEDEDEDDEEVEEVEEDEAMAQYKEETGKSAITAAGTIRKDFLKWKINN